MSTNRQLSTTRSLAHMGWVVSAVLGFALLIMTSGQGSQTLAQSVSTPTSTPTAEPTSIPACPGDRIDRNRNGQDNGDCIPIANTYLDDPLVTCAVAGGASSRYGRIICRVRWIVNGNERDLPAAPLLANQGCVNVRRNPYPRLLVGLGMPTLTYEGLVPTNNPSVNPGNWMTGYQEGWYETGLTGNGLIGLPAGSEYAAGNWLGQAFGGTYVGSEFPPVRVDNVAGDFYPSINNIAMRLVYVLEPADGLEVSFAGMPATIDPVEWNGLEPLHFTVTRSSNPSAAVGTDNIAASGGPGIGAVASLPAYKLRVESTWTLYAQWRFELWEIRGNQYQRAVNGAGQPLPPITAGGVVTDWSPRPGSRVWDSQQRSSNGLMNSPNCNANADEGYIPVPVMEGRSILIR